MTLVHLRNRLGAVRFLAVAVVALATLVWSASARAIFVVNDQWQDTNRTEPTTATTAGPYSENGVDSDGDGDIESRWYRSGTGGTMNVVSTSGGTAVNGTPNLLRTNVSSATSASWTTYFTPEGSEVALTNAGDLMKVTWTFTPTGVNSASASNTGLRLAIVNATTAGRVTTDATPGNDNYAGYGMFMNMKSGNLINNSFQLEERTDPATASALLSATSSWVARSNGASSTTPGYASGTKYTFTMSFTRNAGVDTIGGNADDGLDIVATMSGAGLGGLANQITTSFSDTSPNSFNFDTFALRPSTLEDTASLFDTSLFRVEFVSAVPEASSFLMVGAIGVVGVAIRRMRRRESPDSSGAA